MRLRPLDRWMPLFATSIDPLPPVDSWEPVGDSGVIVPGAGRRESWVEDGTEWFLMGAEGHIEVPEFPPRFGMRVYLLRNGSGAEDGENAEGMVSHEGTLLEDETVATLCDLARENAETAFKDLARMVGVEAERLDELWTGTRRRVTR